MALLQERVFRKTFMVRRVGMLKNPNLNTLSNFIFPRNAMFHWTIPNQISGPDPAAPVFQNLTELSYVQHVITLDSFIGKPIRYGAKNPAGLVLNYHSTIKRFLLTKDANMSNGKEVVVPMMSYAVLPRIYKYPSGMFRNYNRWYNFHHTLFSTVDKMATSTGRVQIIPLKVPLTLPDINLMRRELNNDVTQRTLSGFPNGADLVVLHIYKWIMNPNLNTLISLIKPENLKKIYLLFIDGNNCKAINLGAILSWRVAPKDEGVYDSEDMLDDPDSNGGNMKPYALGLRFLAFINAFINARVAPEVISSDEQVAREQEQLAEEDAKKEELRKEKAEELAARYEALADNENQNASIPDETSLVTPRTNPGSGPVASPSAKQAKESLIEKATGDKKLTVPDVDPDQIFKELTGIITETDDDKELEDILQQVADLSKATKLSQILKSQEEKFETDTPEDEPSDDIDNIFDPNEEEAYDAIVAEVQSELKPVNEVVGLTDDTPALERNILGICADLADNGLLSAQTLHRVKKQASAYKEMKAPGSKETVEKFMQYDPDKIIVEQKKLLEDTSLVLDKSLCYSTLPNFTQKYLNENHEKTIVSTLMALQNGGAAVTNLSKETREDIGGKYEYWSEQSNPVVGVSSKLQIKLPHVDPEDGTFTANGVKYIMRLQKSDLPIKKIKPDTVALSSYYGSKVFVARDHKQVNDFAGWLRREIMVKSMDKEDPVIKSVHVGNFFDHTADTPRLYSAIAMGYSRIDTPTEEFFFDYKNRIEVFGDEAIKLYEVSPRFVLVGRLKDEAMTPIIMGSQGELYTGHQGLLTDHGVLLDRLGLDYGDAPIDFANMTVFGKKFPVGLILAYRLGLTKLMKGMHTKYDIVSNDSRYTVADSQYRLVFKDKTLILNRDDGLSTMVLAGFRAASRILKKIPLAAMDARDTYSPIFESFFPGAKYPREVDMIFNMFIDPITAQVLKEMRLPTDFGTLLVLACRWILVDKHKAEMDQMRWKGYERIAGIAYMELVKAVRAHNSSPNKASKPIELNPFAVWKAVMSDPSVIVAGDINPIEAIKQRTAVTLTGIGGRTSRTVSANNRRFQPSEQGVTSEATVDSHLTGVNTYTSADPKFINIWGMTEPFDPNKDGTARLLSPSALLSAASTNDD